MPYSEAAPQTKYIRFVPKPGLMKRIGKFHVKLYRGTGGLLGGYLDGLNIMLLTTIGKKSGEQRTVPLPFFRDGARYVLIASFGGNDKNPAWFSNLSANPDVELQVYHRKLKARATVLEGEERARVWNSITTAFPRYIEYQKKTERQMPVILLEKVPSKRRLWW